ncbi:MAG TPA: hypothetical protein DCE41_19035 [Cytophagales bacterium]|nr:hypothetical protein [Cytophagales bacterium]HAA17364.1 hypothetical protein [Cytophagales bacterium]
MYAFLELEQAKGEQHYGTSAAHPLGYQVQVEEGGLMDYRSGMGRRCFFYEVWPYPSRTLEILI